jgi:Zn finger protein HypA/HybF involved in hydrogenase expression
MHDGCSGTFTNGQQLADKVRMMGFSEMTMPMPIEMECTECGRSFTMETFESQCSNCKMVYAVTPCHAHDPESIMPAGIGY